MKTPHKNIIVLIKNRKKKSTQTEKINHKFEIFQVNYN